MDMQHLGGMCKQVKQRVSVLPLFCPAVLTFDLPWNGSLFRCSGLVHTPTDVKNIIFTATKPEYVASLCLLLGCLDACITFYSYLLME